MHEKKRAPKYILKNHHHEMRTIKNRNVKKSEEIFPIIQIKKLRRKKSPVNGGRFFTEFTPSDDGAQNDKKSASKNNNRR